MHLVTVREMPVSHEPGHDPCLLFAGGSGSDLRRRRERVTAGVMVRGLGLYEGLLSRLLIDITAPADDPFYRATEDLDRFHPGDVLTARPVQVRMLRHPVRADAWQVRFRSTDTRGGAVAGVTTVMVPRRPFDGSVRPLLSYQPAIDSLGPTGDPRLPETVQFGGERMGIYFVELGPDLRTMRVVYDRAGSALAELDPQTVDWPTVLSGANWLHGCGITAALGPGPATALAAAIGYYRATLGDVGTSIPSHRVTVRFDPAAVARFGGLDIVVNTAAVFPTPAPGTPHEQVWALAMSVNVTSNHVLADEAPEHLLDIGDEGVQVDHSRLHDLAPAEREELLRECGRPLRRLMDLLDVVAATVMLGKVRQQEIGVPADRGEDVVEVVRHAARQLPDRLHLLGLPELALQRGAARSQTEAPG